MLPLRTCTVVSWGQLWLGKTSGKLASAKTGSLHSANSTLRCLSGLRSSLCRTRMPRASVRQCLVEGMPGVTPPVAACLFFSSKKRKTGGGRAHCPPATSVRARLVAQALKPTARGYRGQSPVCTWGCHGPTGPRVRGGRNRGSSHIYTHNWVYAREVYYEAHVCAVSSAS